MFKCVFFRTQTFGPFCVVDCSYICAISYSFWWSGNLCHLVFHYKNIWGHQMIPQIWHTSLHKWSAGTHRAIGTRKNLTEKQFFIRCSSEKMPNLCFTVGNIGCRMFLIFFIQIQLQSSFKHEYCNKILKQCNTLLHLLKSSNHTLILFDKP
jgi:hypothetical protein